MFGHAYVRLNKTIEHQHKPSKANHVKQKTQYGIDTCSIYHILIWKHARISHTNMT